jgi:hypothetical protein
MAPAAAETCLLVAVGHEIMQTAPPPATQRIRPLSRQRFPVGLTKYLPIRLEPKIQTNCKRRREIPSPE